MTKTKKLVFGGVIALIFALACVFAFVLSFGLNLNSQVQTAYALSNPISASNVWYSDGVSDKSFGTTMPTGYSFMDGTLTIADGATPYVIWTEGAGNLDGNLAVKFEGNYGNNTIDITNNHGNLTLTSTTSVNVTLAGLYSSEMIYVEGKVNLNITGPSYAGDMDAKFSKFLVGCPNGKLYVEDDASVTAINPVLHGKTISGTSFEAIVKVGDLALNTTGCFKVGLNTTPTSTDEAYAIKVINEGFSLVSCTKCDNGFVLYSNANKFICEGADATDPDNFDYQTELAKKLKTIEDGNSLTIRQCQVSFNANTGSGTMDSERHDKGNYSLSNCSFTAPSGQQFKCWAVGSAGGTQYNAGANYTITDDVTFYAVWEDAQVQKQDRPAPVGVEAVDCQTAGNNDGQITGVSTEMEYQPDGAMDEWTEITGDTITGLTPGYYNVRYKETEIYNASEPVQVCVGEYVAPATYTISFNANGGTGTMLDVENQTSPYTLPACDFEKEGWHFLEWAMGSTEGIRYSVSSEAEISENTTFYAIWEQDAPTTYTVTYKPNNEAVGVVRSNISAGAYNLEDNHFAAPSGKQFKAWNVNGTEKQPGDTITISENTIIIAVWEDVEVEITYTVTYKPNNETAGVVRNDIPAGAYSLEDNHFVAPAGKQFKAWNVNGTEKQPGDTITISENTIIVAVWEDVEVEITYTVTYKPNNETAGVVRNDIPAGSYNLEDNHFVAPAGKQFKAWNVNGTEKQPGDTITISENTIIIAVWEDIPAEEPEYHYEVVDGVNVYDDTLTAGTPKDVSGLFEEAKAQNGKVELSAGTLTLTFDADAVNAIGGNAVTLTASVLTENLTIDGAQLVVEVSLSGATFATGKATISVPFNTALPEGKVAKVYYVNGNDKTDMNALFADGRVTFETTHFSTFAVVFEDEQAAPVDPVNPDPVNPDPVDPQPSNPEVNPTPEKKGLSAGAIAGIVIAIVVVLAGAGVGVFFLLKKKGVIGGKKTDEPKKEDQPKDESNE